MLLFTECTCTRDRCLFLWMFALENRHLGECDQNSTCSHRRWFLAKRGPDVYAVRPSRGSRVWAGTELSPSSRSPGGCPCGRAGERRLDQACLRESACHLWHVPFTKLECWGNYCSSMDLFRTLNHANKGIKEDLQTTRTKWKHGQKTLSPRKAQESESTLSKY